MAAFQVGYESPSQFSGEYSRLFGAPPLHDIATLANQYWMILSAKINLLHHLEC
jgi:AraC-like DNA-binding protein